MTSSNFKLSRVSGHPVDDAELLADLKRVAEMLGTSTISMPKYSSQVVVDPSHSWPNLAITPTRYLGAVCRLRSRLSFR